MALVETDHWVDVGAVGGEKVRVKGSEAWK